MPDIRIVVFALLASLAAPAVVRAGGLNIPRGLIRRPASSPSARAAPPAAGERTMLRQRLDMQRLCGRWFSGLEAFFALHAEIERLVAAETEAALGGGPPPALFPDTLTGPATRCRDELAAAAALAADLAMAVPAPPWHEPFFARQAEQLSLAAMAADALAGALADPEVVAAAAERRLQDELWGGGTLVSVRERSLELLTTLREPLADHLQRVVVENARWEVARSRSSARGAAGASPWAGTGGWDVPGAP